MRQSPMSPAEYVERAQSQLRVKTRYILGAGGRKPEGKYPHTLKGGKPGCDCSGFACWCWGLDRYQPDLEEWDLDWLNTDSIIRDARTTEKVFYRIWEPQPGCGLIYPGRYKNGERTHIGHMGIYVGETAKYPEGEVIDCAASLARRLTGYAIARRSASLWLDREDSVFVMPIATRS